MPIKIIKLKVYINEINYLLPAIKKLTILELALQNGIYIPHFCYQKTLNIAGNCRICLVEVSKLIKPIVSCLNVCTDNLHVFTNTYALKKYRENVMEFLLINHPLDCPICDQAGECDLQEQAKLFGLAHSRYMNTKKTNINAVLNNVIKLVLNRCILCMRCVRYLSENSQNRILGNLGRGVYAKIGVYQPTLYLNNWNSANIIDICPVGALSLKIKQYTYRPWELTSLKAFDVLDIFGGPVSIQMIDTKVIRILPVLDNLLQIDYISNHSRFNLLSYELSLEVKPNEQVNLMLNFRSYFEVFNLLQNKNLKNFKQYITFNFYSRVINFNYLNNCKFINVNFIHTLDSFNNVFNTLVKKELTLYLSKKNVISSFRFYHKFRDSIYIFNTLDLNIFKIKQGMYKNVKFLQNILCSKLFVFMQNYLQYYAIILEYSDVFKYRLVSTSKKLSTVNLVNCNKVYSEAKIVNAYALKMYNDYKQSYYNILGKSLHSAKENLQMFSLVKIVPSITYVNRLKNVQ